MDSTLLLNSKIHPSDKYLATRFLQQENGLWLFELNGTIPQIVPQPAVSHDIREPM